MRRNVGFEVGSGSGFRWVFWFGHILNWAACNCILRAPIQQLLMRALFDDAAIFQNYNYVSRFNSRQPMRNNQRRSACHNLHQRSLNMLLGLVIQCRGRFVHNQNRRIFEKRTRNRYARCRCPPDNRTPSSPTMVSSPSGIALMNSSA